MRMNKPIALALAPLALAGCAVVPHAPIVESTPWPAGTAVPLGQPVQLGDLAVTPEKVIEDSRCPDSVRCVWAGRLIVRTRIDGAGWRDTANITLGETYGTHGYVVALVSAAPGKQAEREIAAREYRFTYEAR
jgi:hypothetical protein